MRSKWILLGLIVLILITAGAAGYIWTNRNAGAESAQSVDPNVAIPVQRATVTRTVSATGQLEAVRQAALIASAGGRVAEVSIEEGDRVQAGVSFIRLDPTQAQLKVLQAEREYEQARFDSPGGVVEEKRLALESARDDLAATVIEAPFDGVVATLSVQSGDWVGNNTVVAQIIDPSQYQVTIDIDETDLRQVAPGQPVIVRVDAFSGLRLQGRVTRIGWLPKEASDVIVYPVEVRLNETDPNLRPGLTAQVDIVVEQAENALVLPLEAVVETEDGSVVTQIGPNGEHKTTPIVTGLSDGRRIEVRSGLSEGDRVLMNNYLLYQELFEDPSGEPGGSGSGGRSGFGGFGGRGGGFRR